MNTRAILLMIFFALLNILLFFVIGHQLRKKPLQPPYPKWYNSNAHCDYHSGAAGHSHSLRSTCS